MKFLKLRFVMIHFRSPAVSPLHRRRYSAAAHISSSPSHSSSSSSSVSSRRHHYHHLEEESSRNVKVSVWWDFENCSIPGGVNVFLVASRITAALRTSGIKGPVTITAFGDVAQLSRATQEALTSTGICLTHVPHSGKNSSDRSFMADLVYWVSLNPPPVHFFLISGDRDFANILHRLRMSNYNILLATTETAPSVLCSAATFMWPWSSLVKGESITTKHFNHPPDGLYGSMYGFFKGVLDDPFSDPEQVVNSQSDKTMESLSEIKPRPIPKPLVNAIRQVLHSYPEGVILSEFRAELKRNSITIDKDFFGYKKFSSFLSSMPSVLKLIPHPSGEGQPLVIGTHKRVSESVEPSSKRVKEAEKPDREKSHSSADSQKPASVEPLSTSEPSPHSKENGEDVNAGTSFNMRGHDAADAGGLFDRTQKAFARFQPDKAEPEGTDVDANMRVDMVQGNNVVVREGLSGRLWRILNGFVTDPVERKADNNSEVNSVQLKDSGKGKSTLNSCKSLEKQQHENKAAVSKNDSPSIRASEPLKKDTISALPGEQNCIPEMKTSFSSQVANWWNYWIYGKRDDNAVPFKEVVDKQKTDACGESNKAFTSISNQPEDHDLFSKSHFWDALETFLLTSKGSEVVLKSKTREQLVQGLQQEGPQILKDLEEINLLQLINLLIEEKKWLEISASHTFPFKLSLPDKRKSAPSHSHGTNGLSSLFTVGMSNSNKHSLCSGSSDAKPPQNFIDLKTWFQKMYISVDDVEPEEFQKLFESKFGRKIVSSTYGFPDIGSLVAACLTDNACNQGKRKVARNREEILANCHKLLTKLFEEYPEGFNMSIFRPAFMQKYGYILDHQMLGYPKLASLLQIMPGVRIESSYVIPAGVFQSDISLEKPTIAETIAHSSQNDKVEVASQENGGESNSEDSAWDELGPPSDIVDDDATHTKDMQKEVNFDEASLLDEDFSDSEVDAPVSDGSEEQRRKCEEDSSLLQILDSWYNSKESAEKAHAQDADGLVDCSKLDAKNPMDLKFADQKLKARQSRRYSFVSESRDGEKEKLVESILGNLKKAGDTRLRS